jgi:hypothetical protein
MEPERVRPQFCHAVDIFSTVLDAAGIAPPAVVDGVTQQPIDGESMLTTFTDPDAPDVRNLQYFEMMGSRGIYLDGWKAVTDHVPNQFGERGLITGSHDFATDRWSLFDLTDDFSEAHDLADERPELARMLEEMWWAEAGRNQVLPLYEFPASLAHMHPGEWPPPERATYAPGGGPITESQLPATVGGFSLVADVDVPIGGCEGIITAIGDHHGGWAFYLLDGKPVGTFALLTASARVAADAPLSPGRHDIGVRYEAGRNARVVLTVDGADVAESPLAGMFFLPNLSTPGVGMLIGRDRGLPVSKDYQPPFPFTGTLHRVELASESPGAQVDRRTETQAAFASD